MGAELPPKLVWSGRTDIGRVRANNEDAFLGLAITASEVRHLGRFGESGDDQCDYVFAVSDGMGGAMAGEFASRIAIEKITRRLPPLFKQNATGIGLGFSDVLEALFAEIHHALCYLGSCYEECAGMGATLSLCWFRPGWMYFGHIGDSRIYYFPAHGPMRQLTHDDTHVGWLFRRGMISERDAKTHPQRNVLQKALGAGHQFVDPHVGAVSVERGDRFLMCTDGVTDGLFDERLVEAMTGPGSPADNIVNEAVALSGRDNATAVVVDVF